MKSSVKVAKELVRVAKSLMAVPLSYEDPSQHIVKWARQTLMLTLNVDSSWRQIYETFLTFREGTSNKMHYFGVWRSRNGECVGGNASSRIGNAPRAIEVARGGESFVMNLVQRKVSQKRSRGYVTTEV